MSTWRSSISARSRPSWGSARMPPRSVTSGPWSESANYSKAMISARSDDERQVRARASWTRPVREEDPLLVEWAAELAVRIRGGRALTGRTWPAGIPSGPRRSSGCSRPSTLMARLGDPVHGGAARRDPIPDPAGRAGLSGRLPAAARGRPGRHGRRLRGPADFAGPPGRPQGPAFRLGDRRASVQRFQIEAQAAALCTIRISSRSSPSAPSGACPSMRCSSSRAGVSPWSSASCGSSRPRSAEPAPASDSLLIAGEFAPTRMGQCDAMAPQ